MRSALRLATAAVLTAAVAFGAPSSALGSGFTAAALNCLDAPSLTQASRTETPLGQNVTLKTFSYSPGVANGSMFPAKVSAIQGNFATSTLRLSRPAVGASVSQRTLASVTGALGYINTDFFDEGRSLNYSAIIENGSLIYAPPSKSAVVGITQLPYRIETGYPSISPFTIGTSRYVISGVNQRVMANSNTMVAYTPQYANSLLPYNRGGVLLSNGKVVKIYKTRITAKPKAGTLLVANGASSTRVAKIKIGSHTTFKLPAVPAPSRQLKSALVWASGSATVNNVSIGIDGVNTDYWSSGARLYTSIFTTSRATVASDYSIAIDAFGKVKSKSRGVAYRVPAGGYVLQVGGEGAAFYNAATVGSTVSINNRYSSSGNVVFSTAWGSGGQNLRAGSNNQDCDSHHEQIRPRTGIAWNATTGDYWMVTTSSGQNLNDFGFRMGGSTIHQMFDWMKQLGATDGVVMDGGGTTSMFARISGSVERIDVPNEAWVRAAPLGLIASAND